jgi:hypothetical protein
LFLGLPWILRATVSQLNIPTLRQIYLPILLGGPLMVSAALARRARKRALDPSARVPALLGGGAAIWLVGLIAQTIVSGGMSPAAIAQRQLASSIRSVMAGIPADHAVMGIGEDDDLCDGSPLLTTPGGSIHAIPAARDDSTPALIPLDAHTLLVRASGALDILTEEQRPVRSRDDDRGPFWIVRRPPPLVTLGWQRLRGATVSVAERGPSGIQALRYAFDRPLSQLTFLRLRGCRSPERVDLAPLGG